MADERWQYDDDYRRRRYGYDDDYDARNDEWRAREERYGNRGGARGSEYSSLPGIGTNYGGAGWTNEYSTDWRRRAERDYPSEGQRWREPFTRDYPGQRADWGRSERDRGDWGRGSWGRGSEWDRPHERGWWDRTKDEVRSWMGDTDAERRRQADHTGRGPKGYTRSDDRIREDVSDRLMEDWGVDATDIEVSVSAGEVTLSGTVDRRESKRRAENIAAAVLGVKDVQNNIRVRKMTSGIGGSSAETTGTSTSSTYGTTGVSTTPRH